MCNCGENETIVHMFVECENVKKSWHLLEYITGLLRIKVTGWQIRYSIWIPSE